jgi:hypothetical protein
MEIGGDTLRSSEVNKEHIKTITGQVIDRLVKYAAGPRTPFGELMRNLRRDLLAQGYPAVLSLIAYGDADWELGLSPRRVDDVHG